uniref:SFRICE_013603 n=1 Tax=Spodoptera frugiperda TaxID=7108 RepID=A0A2H1VGT5_SPOFR
MEISVDTFDRICRVCLVQCADMKSLFTKIDGEKRNLFEILVFTANINVKYEDPLPKLVCSECETIMCKADAFKRRCLNSDTILNEIYQSSLIADETSINDKKYSIKDENGDLAEKLCSYVPFEVPNTADYDTQDHFDKKNVVVRDTSIFATTDGSFCEQTTNDVSVNSEQLVKEEINLNFDEDIGFADHYDDEMPCSTSPNEFKDKAPEYSMYKCHCGTTFHEKDKYDSHIKQKCKNKKVIVKKSKVIRKNTEINCGVCNSTFNNLTALKQHQQVHSNETDTKPQDYICKLCLVQFKTKSALVSHIKKHEKTVNTKSETYQCSFCLRKFKNKSSLSAHMQRHEQTDSIKHICKVCKREFKYKAYLENHISTMHSRKIGISCEVCAQTFPNEESLELHKDSHKNEKKHRCTVCNKGFLMLCTLKEHMRTHTGEKPFLCSQCGRGFSQKTNLAQHMRRHQGLKPFKCENCEKRFVSKGELDAHNRKHSGAHPFVCDDCGNGFTTSSALVKHRRIHTGEKPYQCDLCPMRFAASGTLKNHRRTHTGERPFQCSYCEKAFVQRNDLISHIRCHTGEKPYVCTQCGQSFRKASGLKSHVKMHVKEPVLMPGVNVMLNGMHCAEQ